MVEVTVCEASVQCLLFSSALIGITQPKVVVCSDHHSSEQNGCIAGRGSVVSVTPRGMWDGLIYGTCNVAL
jgi:hypothetical protein